MVALILHPEYERWKKEVANLRHEVAHAIEELDHLRNNVKPILTALYLQKIGASELECLREQCRAEWVRRYVERVRSALNRGLPVVTGVVEDELREEMAAFWRRVREMAAKNKAAQELLSHLLPPEEALAMRKLFRDLVKRLHPDVNPTIGDRERLLLRRAQQAYEMSDMDELKAIAAALDAAPSTDEPEGNENRILKERDRLLKVIAELRSKIEALEAQSPFNLSDNLNDDAWVEAERAKIESTRLAWAQKIAEHERQLKNLLGDDYGAVRFGAD